MILFGRLVPRATEMFDMKAILPNSVKELVQDFSLAERQMLMLHWAEEMSPSEIGQVLDLPELCVMESINDIRQRVSRAVRTSRQPRKVA